MITLIGPRTKQEYLQYYRDYRKKVGDKMRAYKRKYNKEWRKKNGFHNEINSKNKYPEKQRARRKLQYAVKTGKVIKESCKRCGNPRSQGHHSDYSKPLDVIWLCALHHKELHS